MILLISGKLNSKFYEDVMMFCVFIFISLKDKVHWRPSPIRSGMITNNPGRSPMRLAIKLLQAKSEHKNIKLHSIKNEYTSFYIRRSNIFRKTGRSKTG